MARLSAVPATSPRAIAYIRVSKEQDDGISPELQQAAIEDYCAARGYTIVETITDLDLSGRLWKRRRVETAVQKIEAGDADVLVVWKWSRVARNRLDWAIAVDRVEAVKGRLESATEPLDATTSTGRLARGMLAEIAAFESDRMGDVWREVHARRTRQGLPANGKPRFGYRHVNGIHEPDPDTGPILADLYHRYIAGESTYGLVVWLNQRGIRTVGGYSAKGPGEWSMNSLRQMLDTGFGAGYITVHGERQPGAHEPVIDANTWTAYQAARIRRRPLKRAQRSPYLLTSLVECGRCGSPMGYGRYGRNNDRLQLRCAWSTTPSGTRHDGAFLRGWRVEELVREWIDREAARQITDATADLPLRRAEMTRRRHDAKAIGREVVKLDQAIARLTVDRAKGTVPAAAYTAALAELTRERDATAERHTLALADAQAEPPTKVIAQLSKHWDLYSVEHRRELLRQVVQRVVVTGPEPIQVVVVPK